MSRFALMMSRFLVTSWVGAAGIFIWVTVMLAISPDLDSIAKDKVALIRFPIIYQFSFYVLVPAYVFHLISFRAMRPCFTRWVIAAFTIPFLVMLGTVDYFNVYLPIADMIDPPGMVRPMQFHDYHDASERMGGMMFVLGLLTALMLNWPVKAGCATHLNGPDEEYVPGNG
ncbi:hypothetical protein [Lacunimicrobium album]